MSNKKSIKPITIITPKGIFPYYIEKENASISKLNEDNYNKPTDLKNPLPTTNNKCNKKESADLSDQKLIELVVQELKGRKDYMSIISEIIYDINDNK